MKNKKIVLFTVICSLILLRCNAPFNPLQQNEPQLPQGYGAFSLSVDGARTILPDTTISSFQVYTLEFTGVETLSVERTNSNLSAPINLKAGTYSLTITAYMDTAKLKPAALGSLNEIIITAGQTTSRTISLNALGMTTGRGTFSWNIDFPDGLSEVSVKITPVNTSTGTPEQILYFKGGASLANKIAFVELNSGVYRVVFTLTKDVNTQTVIWRDAVHVYQNMTSVFNKIFTEEYFNNIKYTVTFVFNDKTSSDSIVDYLHGQTVSTPASLSRTGYIFDSWYTDDGNFQNKYDFSALLTGDLKLYIKWNPISYKISYNKNSTDATGTTADSDHIYDVDNIISSNGYTRAGYTFAGWARTEDGTVEFQDKESVVNLTAENNATVTLYARWGSQSYYIAYDKNSDEAQGDMGISIFYFGLKVDLKPNTFTRTGYTFAGWAKTSNGAVEFTDKQAVIDLATSAGATVTLYAKWTANVYTIAYNKNASDATGTTDNSSHTYDVDKTLTGNGYSRTGYTFAGWTANSDGSGTSYTDGQSVKNLTATAGATVTLYAKWTATYTVIYNKNASDATGTTDNSSHTYDVDKTLTGNGYSRTGYTFDCWTANYDGTGTSYTDGQNVKNLASTAGATVTLYARWKLNTYTITYYPDGGSPVPSNTTVNYNATINHPPTMTKTDYTFDKWYTDSAKTSPAVFPITVTGDVNLYARWLYIEMVWVEGGTFRQMEEWIDSPRMYTVTLSGFYMGKYEVTQEQWVAVMGSNPSYFQSSPASGEVQNKRPVELVSWYDVIEFCNALSIKEGLSTYYNIDKVNKDPNNTNTNYYDNMKWTVTLNSAANGYRLPTEAQWEYAARGGNGSPNNYVYSGSNTIEDVAWYLDNSNEMTHEVGKKIPNSLGLYDMSGNVWEWCWDWYEKYASGAQTDPYGAVSGSYRVHRGGCWRTLSFNVRSACRSSNYPNGRSDNVGFRLARP